MEETLFWQTWLQTLPAPPEKCLRACVVNVQRQRVRAAAEDGREYWTVPLGKFRLEHPDFVTVGDYLWIRPTGGEAVAETLLPRKSLFLRSEPGPVPRAQAAAANFDTVFIVTSLNHELNRRRLERYLAAAWESGGDPVIVMTKADLAPPVHLDFPCPCFAVSAPAGLGMEALTPYLAFGRTVVLLGSSGVGKSTLVNALMGRPVMATREIREDDAHGRHTTTSRQMLVLPGGARIIDTPGMRQLGLWDAREGMETVFADLEELAQDCRFRDCTHENEPGCRLRAAVEAGELDPATLKSYRRLSKEARRGSRPFRKKEGKPPRMDFPS